MSNNKAIQPSDLLQIKNKTGVTNKQFAAAAIKFAAEIWKINQEKIFTSKSKTDYREPKGVLVLIFSTCLGLTLAEIVDEVLPPKSVTRHGVDYGIKFAMDLISNDLDQHKKYLELMRKLYDHFSKSYLVDDDEVVNRMIQMQEILPTRSNEWWEAKFAMKTYNSDKDIDKLRKVYEWIVYLKETTDAN